ncbi:MAG: hypothetical protein AAF211_08515, partial [Myxococcota bacterium]
MKRRVPFLFTAALALVLAWVLAPRPSLGVKEPSGPVSPAVRAVLGMTEAPVNIRPLVIGRHRSADAARPARLVPHYELADPAGTEEPPTIRTGFLSGHVVDESG